jgi:hypothetical protein
VDRQRDPVLQVRVSSSNVITCVCLGEGGRACLQLLCYSPWLTGWILMLPPCRWTPPAGH